MERLLAQGKRPGRTMVRPKPVPEHHGEPSVFRHVVYVIKENQSIDGFMREQCTSNFCTETCPMGPVSSRSSSVRAMSMLNPLALV